MMIMKSRKYSKTREDIELELKGLVLRFASKEGIPNYFIMDSKAVMDSVHRISSRIADLSETVIIDKHQIKMEKETKKFREDMVKAELKQSLAKMTPEEFDELMHERKKIKKVKK